MATPVLPPLLREGDRLTREEFLRRWDAMPELKRAELIGGVVRMPSPISDVHSYFQARLSIWLGLYVIATPGCDFRPSATWLMSGDDVPQPDLALRIDAGKGGQSRIEGIYAAGAPELAVEISYTTTARDAGAKLKLYERSGVREYLIVKPKKREVVWRELVNGKYRDVPPDSEGLLRSNVFPGLWLDPRKLWNNDLPGLSAVVQRGVASEQHAAFVRKLA